MAKPDEVYEFATDADATSDPGLTRRATGFVAGKRLPAKWLNWALNGAGKWAAYVSNLHGEPEFLNKAYAWTAAHTFAAIAVAGTATAQEFVYPTKIEREVLVPLTAFVPTTHEGSIARNAVLVDLEDSGLGWILSASDRIVTDLSLPHGAEITRVRAWVTTSTALTMTLKSHQLLASQGTPSGPTTTIVNISRSSDGVLDTGVIEGGTMDRTMLSGTTRLRLAFTATNTTRIFWVRVTYLDPGPRNY